MDEKKDMLLTAELKEEEKIEADSPTETESTEEAPSPAQTGSILKKIFVSAMCLVTLTTALFCGIYIWKARHLRGKHNKARDKDDNGT